MTLYCNIGTDQAAVQRLMTLGFTQQECVSALQMYKGNEEQAASLLFESNFGA